MIIYLDTNFFLYLSDATSSFYSECKTIVSECQNKGIVMATSVETIQEIINYSKNVKELDNGLAIAERVIKIVDQLYPVYPSTIQIYLDQAEIYHKPSSRDLLHLAICIENNIKYVLTYDKDFMKFVDIEPLTPAVFMAKYS
jgi:predicted nucleic acid-binding protein